MPRRVGVTVFDRIREACAEVAARADSVRIDREALERFAEELASDERAAQVYDPVHHHVGDRDATLAYVLTLDAINFGSGWFPVLDKLPGHSGYLTVATRLKAHFEREGPLPASQLQTLDGTQVARILGQRDAGEAGALMALYAQALRELGDFLEQRYGGRFEGPVEAAEGSAAAFVGQLAELPLYADVSTYRGAAVPFYKRAQITVADLALAFEGEGPGAFQDIDALTIFADNLVPHVLRRQGVLVYEESLGARIEAGALLPAGCEEEVEIRACAVHAVEQVARQLASRGAPMPVREIDGLLWSRGQAPEVKSHPRHRTRTCFY